MSFLNLIMIFAMVVSASAGPGGVAKRQAGGVAFDYGQPGGVAFYHPIYVAKHQAVGVAIVYPGIMDVANKAEDIREKRQAIGVAIDGEREKRQAIV